MRAFVSHWLPFVSLAPRAGGSPHTPWWIALALGLELVACSDPAPPVSFAPVMASAAPASSSVGIEAQADASTATPPSVLRPTGAPAPPPPDSAQYATSAVLNRRDRVTPGGKSVCDIRFVYAGRAPESLFWEEPCAAVTAKMVDRTFLETHNRWTRLDDFEQGFVRDMPGGKVLYVEGAFSAAVYPIDTTGTSIEVFVAD